jgi:hypothetical protein
VKKDEKLEQKSVDVPSLSDSKLRDISWSLDINEYVDTAGKGINKMKK